MNQSVPRSFRPPWRTRVPWALQVPRRSVSRRSLLLGATAGIGLVTASACTPPVQDGEPPGRAYLEPVLTAAVYMASRYEEAVTAVADLAARLNPLREVHQAHVTALTRELGTVTSGALPSPRPPSALPRPSATSPSPTPTLSGSPQSTATTRGPASPEPPLLGTAAPLPTERRAILADLRALEEAGANQARAACLNAALYHAPLLGSIAAARASAREMLG